MYLTKEQRLDLVRTMAAKGITRVWLAEEIGKSGSLISRFLKSKYDFPASTQQLIYDLISNYKVATCDSCGCDCNCNKS